MLWSRGASVPELVTLGESGATGMGGVHRRGNKAGSWDLKARGWRQAPSVTRPPHAGIPVALPHPASECPHPHPPFNPGPSPFSFREEEQGSQPGA